MVFSKISHLKWLVLKLWYDVVLIFSRAYMIFRPSERDGMKSDRIHPTKWHSSTYKVSKECLRQWNQNWIPLLEFLPFECHRDDNQTSWGNLVSEYKIPLTLYSLHGIVIIRYGIFKDIPFEVLGIESLIRRRFGFLKSIHDF